MKTFRQFLEQDISSVEQRRRNTLGMNKEKLEQDAERRKQESEERAAKLEAERQDREE